MTTATVNDAQIREAAYFAWLNEGRPEGRAEAHWQAAVDALNAPAPKKRRTAKPKAAAARPKAAAKPKASAKTKTAGAKPRTRKAKD